MDSVSRFSQRVRLRHLHAFVATAQQGTLGRAARQLGITQPALSKTLSELEDLTGKHLLLRSRQGTELTASGTRFLHDAIRILDALHSVDQVMRPDSMSRLAPLHIGALPTAIISVVAPVLASLHHHYPGWRIQVSELANDALLRAIKSGQIAVGIGRMAEPALMNGLNFELLYLEILRLVVAPQHPLLHAGVTLAEALRWPLVLSPRGTVPRQNAESLMTSHGLTLPEAAVETISTTLARRLTLNHDYVWLVPYGAVRDDLTSNNLRALPLPRQGMAEAIGILTRQQHTLIPEHQQLMAALRQQVLDVPI